jgi:hypothetical protein
MKIAVYVDCENIHHDYASQLFEYLSGQGKIVLCNGYADFSNSFYLGWKQRLIENKMRAIQVFHNTKDGADAEIIIDMTLDSMKYVKADCFCVVSNDGIYSCLARPIHLNNKMFMAIGTHATNKTLSNACDIFKKLENRKPENKSVYKPDGSEFIDDAIDRAGGGRVILSRLGIELSCLGFNVREYGYERLIDFIDSLGRYILTRDEQNELDVYVQKKE